MQYDFQEQLAIGKHAETFLDAFFSRWYEILPVTLAEEKREGIDRIFKRAGRTFKVEYKADSKASVTGNLFIEFEVRRISNDSLVQLGWAAKSQADYVIYWAQPSNIFVIRQDLLRLSVTQGEFSDFQVGKSMNHKIYGLGYLVRPQKLSEFVVAHYRLEENDEV